MPEITRAAMLLGQARQLVESAAPSDQARRKDAISRAGTALRLVGSSHRRAARLLAAEAREITSAIEITYDDFELGLGGLLGAATCYIELGDADDARRGLARVTRILSGAYGRVGMRERAEALAFEYLRILPANDRDVFVYAYVATCFATAGHPAQLVNLLDRYQPDEYPEPVRSVLTVLAERADDGSVPLERLATATRSLRFAPPDVRLQCALFAANSLLRRGQAALAVEVLAELRAGLGSDLITDARIAQAMGAAASRAGDPDLALQLHLLAWTRYDDLRYQVGSLRVRRAIEAEFTRSRAGALAVAAARSDVRLLLELIESCRLQATVDIAGSITEVDGVVATGVYTERAPAQLGGALVVDPDRLPPTYRDIVDDLFGGRADLADRVDIYVGGFSSLAEARAMDLNRIEHRRLDASTVICRHSHSGDLWWSSWYDNGVLYWVLSRDGQPAEGGTVDIAGDVDLREALSVVSLRYHIRPPWTVPPTVAGIDLTNFLAVADSTEELHLTTTLARVLPASIQSAPAQSRLYISCAPELAAIPWPILPLQTATAPVRRLVEDIELRFLPSLVILDRVPVGAADGDGGVALPFLLTCDYFPVQGRAGRLPRRLATMVLAAPELSHTAIGVHEASSLNLVRFLRTLPRGALGMAFFRTHYEWVEADPGSSGLALTDGIMPSGVFGVHDGTTGASVINLPSTVVMSCCSTSGARERAGGETLGLAPLMLMAGAQRAIVTSVEIRHTAFTEDLDDMLIDVALAPGDIFVGVRELQLRLLEQWRRYSPTGVAADAAPTPDIWAHYQAFGVP